jgi:hypothetical protein
MNGSRLFGHLYSYYMRTERHGQVNRDIFVSQHERPQNPARQSPLLFVQSALESKLIDCRVAHVTSGS